MDGLAGVMQKPKASGNGSLALKLEIFFGMEQLMVSLLILPSGILANQIILMAMNITHTLKLLAFQEYQDHGTICN
jgi:hypothetical protein